MGCTRQFLFNLRFYEMLWLDKNHYEEDGYERAWKRIFGEDLPDIEKLKKVDECGDVITYEVSKEKGRLLVFNRYYGCQIWREVLSKANKDQICSF